MKSVSVILLTFLTLTALLGTISLLFSELHEFLPAFKSNEQALVVYEYKGTLICICTTGFDNINKTAIIEECLKR